MHESNLNENKIRHKSKADAGICRMWYTFAEISYCDSNFGLSTTFLKDLTFFKLLQDLQYSDYLKGSVRNHSTVV